MAPPPVLVLPLVFATMASSLATEESYKQSVTESLAFHKLDQVAFTDCRQEVGTELVLHWKRIMAAYYIADIVRARQEVVAQQSMNLGYLMYCALWMSLYGCPIFFIFVWLI